MVEDRNTEPEKQREVTASEAVGFFTGLLHKFLTGVFSEDHDEHWREHIKRLIFGALGGVFYAVFKNYATQGAGIVKVLMMEPGIRKSEMLIGYWMGPLMALVTGAAVAWLSNLKSKRLLFLVGVMGTFIVTSLFPGLPSGGEHIGKLMNDLMPISTAAAADDTECVGDSAFVKGFKAFFGVQTHYDRYAVIVGSAKSKSAAEAKLKYLKAKYPDLDLRVGPRACDNIFYPIFASSYLPLEDAKKELKQIKQFGALTADAYLSPGPRGSQDN